MNNSDAWPRLAPVIVTQEITAATDTITGIGKVKILRAVPTATAGEYNTLAIPDNADPDEMQVLIRDKRDPVAVGTVGFVAQDMWGTLWWVSSPTKLVRFTLVNELPESGYAIAAINSDGADNGTYIGVTAWAKSRGAVGDRGIAWLNNDTYWVLELSTCNNTLYKFRMLANWSGTTASAKFWLAGTSVDTGGVIDTVRDELSIFADVLSFGKWGLAIRNCAGQFFVIQAACSQVTLGSCVHSGESGPTCEITTSDACDALSGVWTEGEPCP